MIRILSKDTIDKIAAGEVIERPISVVKELIENSIDAKSSAISVEIKNGGIDLIRVTDNGSGIENDDITVAFMRHATSKIEDSRDLYSLKTLGFRGEALSSISAVSRLTLITKPKEEFLGKRVTVIEGEIKSIEDTAAPNGSTFIVEDLFYNTPARKKFLKSPMAEGSAIEEMMSRLALSHPEISFKLIVGNKEKLFTSGKGDLKQCIYEIYGLTTAENILELTGDYQEFNVRGFIGTSSMARGSRKDESFFINGRYIKNPLLSKALEAGYEGYLMQHKFPLCILFFEFPDGSTDVNVHPSKMEVRFDEAEKIQKALESAVANRLRHREDIEILPLVHRVEEDFHEDTTTVSYSQEKTPDTHTEIPEEPFGSDNNTTHDFSERKTYNPEPFEEKKLNEIKENLAKKISADSPYSRKYDYVESPHIAKFIEESSKPSHRIIGQVFGTYWLFEFDGKLYILDQHAAHEKVLYERIMKKISNDEVFSQRLMPPAIVTLSPGEERILAENMDAFEAVGFEVEHFGGMDYCLSAVPGGLPGKDPAQLFTSILLEGSATNTKLITERVAAISCKAAIKGNHTLSLPEIEALVDELMTLDNPYHCPHGRPTFISFTRNELDKKFKRIV